MTQVLRSMALCCAGFLLAVAPLAAQEDANAIRLMEFRQGLQRAIEHFNARNFALATRQCDMLDQLQPSSPVVINMRGAIALEERQFDKGAEYCQKALEIDPKFFPARFNMAEIPFLQKKYEAARDIYQQLLAEDPRNELLQYRIFLTYLLEGNEGAAEEALRKVRFPGDTAAYYFAHAAWEFQHQRPAEAEGWINSADWVFSKQKNIYFADVLYDLGWVKRPGGKETAASELRLLR